MGRKKGHPVSLETRRKLRKANIGKRLSEETKRKIGKKSKGNKYCLGRHLSEEHKRKISKSLKGHVAWFNGLPKEKHPRYGKRHSKEAKRKMRQKRLGGAPTNHGGNLGKKRHQNLVKEVTSLLDDGKNKVEIEKAIKLSSKHWRIVDILINGQTCYEIGYCSKEKIEELTNHGFVVKHLPYSLFKEG